MALKGSLSKYKKEYDEKLIDHMAEGFSFESFAGLISVNQDTLYEWAKVHPSFSEAKKTAYEKSRLFWEHLSNKAAQGKIPNANATLIIFNKKNRFPKEWRDRKEVVADITTHEVVDKEQLKKMAQLILDDE